MANILGRNQLTGGGKLLLEVDADPSAGAGTPAPIGSESFLSLAGVGSAWIKTGAANTAWTQVSTGTGTGALAFTTKTANYSMLTTDRIIFCDTSGGAFNVTLPDPTLMGGIPLYIIDSTGFFNTNNLTLVRFAGELLEGLASSKVLQTTWGWFTIVSNGVNWLVGG